VNALLGVSANHLVKGSQFVSAIESRQERLTLFGREVEETLAGLSKARRLERRESLMIGGTQPRQRSFELLIHVVHRARLRCASLILERNYLLGNGSDQRRFLDVQKVRRPCAAPMSEAAAPGDPKQRHPGILLHFLLAWKELFWYQYTYAKS